ncbi:MAG: hypothetical protein AMXMBFR53_02010 [Gemmatimonadota bacterium]
MNVAWILQGLLAITFAGSGIRKLVKTREDLRVRGGSMAWLDEFGTWQMRTIGALEVLGAVGLVIPTLTGVLVFLTPLAAGGLFLMMLGAWVTHMRRGEFGAAIPSVALGTMALWVIVLRL